MAALWPARTYTGVNVLVRPLRADHRSPVDEVTAGSNARVTAVSDPDAVAAGAPEAGYGPISSGLTDHTPGLTSGSDSVRLAESPEVTPGRSGSPGEYSRSKF